ncbi:MAG: DUF4105 domain-containing protein [Bacteriovoracaceae bacterium]
MLSLVLIILTTISLHAQTPADLEQLKTLSESKAWHKLVHYQESVFGNFTSNADTKEFFLSEEGRKNPLKELEATYQAFQKIQDYKKESILCRFPARYLWLKKNISLPQYNLAKCTEYEAFREKINPEKAYVVFSSYFINTPASAFGHTLLRFQRKDEGEKNHSELLDYGVNYAAVVTTENALVYAVMGMAGGFNGVFAAIPYYYKIREYNDYESRDLYSYELSLNAEELNFMLAHLWELGQTSFDYYYLTQNCSYHVLNLIDVARPELEIMKALPFYVIPVDTIKALYSAPGLVTKVDYRPSLRNKLYSATKDFDRADVKKIEKLAEHGDDSYMHNFTKEEKARDYDLAIDYYDYVHAKQVLFNAGIPEAKRNLLIKRSELEISSPPTNVKMDEKQFPHLSHAPERAMYGFGSLNDSTYSSLEYRFALHDLLDSTIGEPPNLHIDFAKLRFNYFHQTHKLKFDDFTLFQVLNLSPISKFDTPFSWRANLGAKTIYDRSCNGCFAANTELAGGASFTLDHKEKVRLFTFLDGEINAGKFLKNNFRVGAGPLAGLYTEFTPKLLMINQVGYKYYFFVPEMGNVFYKNELRLTLTQDIAIGVQTLNQTFYDQYQGNFYWYF